ncbi:MAG TPA: DUF3037 domain-containing protein [Gemmatimonadales bacterium]|nr:DUF3037 domain-containing protein [Gemmatimonadales bacterium]
MASFDYALLRVVPRVDRGEQLNAGVILYCRERSFLAAALALDRDRLRALWPAADIDAIAAALEVIPRICAGDAAAGEVAALSQAERFHWLVAPRSTITQPGPVHSGLCDDPAEMLAHLVETMVKVG